MPTSTPPMPMLADFAIRLSGGLAALLLLTPWRAVPPAFFRTLGQIALGLLVLALLDQSWTGSGRALLGSTAACAILAYAATIAWGLGLPRLAVPTSAALALAAAGLLVWASGPAPAGLWAFSAAGRWSSALLLGATLTAMLLGHHYLTATTMAIGPLRRLVALAGAALAVRAALGAAGLALWWTGRAGRAEAGTSFPLFLSMRWGMGIFGPALAATLAWKTVQIRSTQSATGILYIGMTLVLFGELTALILTRENGILF